MRAIVIREFGGPEQLQQADLPRPAPQRGEVLLRVVAAGVNPVDCRIRAGRQPDAVPYGLPMVPGWDAAGVVEEFGDGVTRFRRGDRVWACLRQPPKQWGCYAEYASVPEQGVAIMPSKLLFEEAAAVPLCGLTAYQALVAGDRLTTGSSVLIHGAAGGVGHLALQLARHVGVTAYATAGAEHQSFVTGLGAVACIDTSREEFTDAIHRHRPEGVDLVLDTLGGDMLDRSYGVVKRGGEITSTVETPDPHRSREAGIHGRYLQTRPDPEQLALLARIVDQGPLRPAIHRIFGLAQASEAHATLEAGGVPGKLVLNL